MTLFPTALDNLTNPTSLSNQSVLSHSDQHANANDAIEILEAKVWIDWSADTDSLDYKTSRLTAKGDILTHDWTNPIKQAVGTNGYMLVADNTSATWLNYVAPTSWGTVTSVAFTNTNWVNGTISNPTTDPALALSFPNSGIQKSNGTALSSATAWTDYSVPTGTETLTNKTMTSPVLNYPKINIGSDADWDMYYRDTGVLVRIPVWSENDTLNVVWGVPTWSNPVAYTWTLIADTTSATWAGNTAPTTTRTVLNLTSATVSLNWSAWSARFEYYDWGAWTTIVTTASAVTFPVLLRKWYDYRCVAVATVNWPTSTVSITYIL